MYTLLKSGDGKKTIAAETPALAFSLLLAESLYKFGSFTLECIAFLITWFVTSYLLNTFITHQRNRRDT